MVAIAAVFAAGAATRATRSARAETQVRYSRILGREVVLYMDENLSMPWFTLPYSYYVKVVSVGAASAKVEYKGDSPARPSLKGYLRLSDLNVADETPAAPYPTSIFTVGQSCLVYKDVNFNFSDAVPENSSVDFYGTSVRAGGQVYVFGCVTATSGDKYIGFIEKNALLAFALPELPVALPEPEPESATVSAEPAPGAASNALGDNLQIVIIVGISVVAVSIVYLLFRPSQGRAKEEVAAKSDFDDDE